MINRLIVFFYKFLPKNLILFLGKSNFVRPLRNRILRPSNKEKIIDLKIKWGNGEFFFFAPIKIATKAKQKGIENKLLKNSLHLIQKHSINSPIILDVGANYGFVSLALQSNLSKDAQIYAFEPHPTIVSDFRKSIDKNKIDNIIVENVAVGSKNDLIEINLYGQSSNILTTEGIITEKIKIKQVQLDSFLDTLKIIPHFIKIDVDGYELQVLEGLEQTLKNYHPLLVVETNDNQEILTFLKNRNYQLFNLDLEEFTEIPNNIFCIHKS